MVGEQETASDALVAGGLEPRSVAFKSLRVHYGAFFFFILSIHFPDYSLLIPAVNLIRRRVHGVAFPFKARRLFHSFVRDIAVRCHGIHSVVLLQANGLEAIFL